MAAGQFEGDIVNVTSVDINELLMTTNNARNAIRNKLQLWPNGKVSFPILHSLILIDYVRVRETFLLVK